MVSTRFSQCQTVIHNNLQKYSNKDIESVMIQTATLIYNMINSKQQKQLKKDLEITSELSTEILVIKLIWAYGIKSPAEIFQICQFQSCHRVSTISLYATSTTP